MNRTILSAAAAGLLLLGSAIPALADEGDAGKLMIMKHACTEQPVKDQADFDAIVAQAGGDEVTALALTVLACPTIVLSDDEGGRTDGVAGPAVDFDFTVTDANGDTQTLADAEFVAAKLCETDIQRDANGDGEFSAEVCLDISHYMFDNLPAGEVTVEETMPPNGWKFGTLLLTPQALQASGSNDAATGASFDAGSSTVTLDLSGDADNDAMLHIYNFENSPSTDTVSAATESSDSANLPIAAIAALSLAGGAFALRRRLA
jgi:hypothetical protein